MQKRSVALVMRKGDERILAVRRPRDDEELPDAWGLPAATLGPDESWTDAVRRAAREKLGVEVEVGDLLGEGSLERFEYVLEMRLYEARIVSGEPQVEQPDRGATLYQEWMWAKPRALEPAAARGSLCARLFLDLA